MADEKKPVFTAEDRRRKGLETFAHPLNPERSQMRGISLSQQAGLARVAVHVGVLPPGKESFVYHSHALEEEWMFVLSGRGRMEIDGELHDLGPGDFVGFAAPSKHHQLHNPYDEDLTYLTGGERGAVEVAELPRLNLVMVRRGVDAMLYPLDAGKSFHAMVGEEPGAS